LNSVIQQNASVSEEIASSSEELSSQAEQLREVIGFFKIESGFSSKSKTEYAVSSGNIKHTTKKVAHIASKHVDMAGGRHIKHSENNGHSSKTNGYVLDLSTNEASDAEYEKYN